MGMYTEINGQEIKLSGALANAAVYVKIWNPDEPYLELNHSLVGLLIQRLGEVILENRNLTGDPANEAGESLVINICEVKRLEIDIRKLSLLIDWYNTHCINDRLVWQ